MAAPKMRGFVCVRDLRADCCDTYEAGGKGIPDRTFAVGYKGEISAEAAACATKGGIETRRYRIDQRGETCSRSHARCCSL